MFGNHIVADIIAYHCSCIDNLCRQELHRGTLVSERDYVTALSTRIRDEIEIQLHIPCHSQTVRMFTETENGVDGIIVFKYNDEVKVGLFEAKRPKIYNVTNPTIINNYNWDSLSRRGTSHFSEQIQKQHKWKGEFALWEMFFNDGPKGFGSPPFEYLGSSCIWHDNAYRFMNAQGLVSNPWTTPKLQILLHHSCVNFYTIIFDILSCKEGKLFRINNESKTVKISSPDNDNSFMDIPLPLENTKEYDERIDDFLITNNLENYTFMNLDNLKNRIH